MKITNLKLNSLRGIPSGWPALQIGERGLVVLGPNGAGKSSIVDGLEFAITNSSSLFSENRSGVSWNTASPHIMGGKLKVDLTLKFNGQDYILTTASKPAGEVSKWLGEAAKSRFVLRRHMLLKFIEGTPKDRYSRLEPFLNLQQFIELESSLEQISGAMKTAAVAAEAAASKVEQKLRAVFSLADDTDVSEDCLFDILNMSLSKLSIGALENNSNFEQVESLVDAELRGYAQDTRLSSLQNLKTELQKLTLPVTYRPLLDHLRASLHDLKTEEMASSGNIPADFLIKGKNIISATAAMSCPICEQSIEREALVLRLNERIDADSRLIGAQNAVKAAKRAALNPIGHLAQAIEQFLGDWQEVMPIPLDEKYRQTRDLLMDAVTALNEKIDAQTVQELSIRFSATIESHENAAALIAAQIDQEAGGERRQLLAEARDMLRALQKDWKTHEILLTRVNVAHRRRRVAERIHGHAVESRKRTVQIILEEVAGIANRFYDDLHPGEKIGNSKLLIRANQEGSVTLQTEFYGKEGPPLLHYSESHLDTLGLCYFLALRKRESQSSPSFKLVVLDDVMHSVDSRHRAKFAALLSREFADHQIILVTHDEIFYQKLRHSIGSKCKFLSITDWDINRGPFLGDASTDLDVILDEQLQRSKSSRDLAAACGRFFEWFLRNVTENLNIAIPARFSRNHDIGSMWQPLASKMRKQRYFYGRWPTICEEIEAHGWVRNMVGAHHNETDAPPEPTEVRNFARSLATLYGSMYCDSCETFLVKSGDHDWHCKCGTLRYSAN